MCCSIRRCGLVWLAPECSSWVRAPVHQRIHVSSLLDPVPVIRSVVLYENQHNCIRFCMHYIKYPSRRHEIVVDGDESVAWVAFANRTAVARTFQEIEF